MEQPKKKGQQKSRFCPRNVDKYSWVSEDVLCTESRYSSGVSVEHLKQMLDVGDGPGQLEHWDILAPGVEDRICSRAEGRETDFLPMPVYYFT